MSSGKSRYKKVTDLYVTGVEVVLRDGAVVWLQALNPFEYDDAKTHAQSVRARYVMAMKDIGSDEYARFEAFLEETPREQLLETFVESKGSAAVVKVIEGLEDDPEWKEVREILERADDDSALAMAPEETALVAKANADWLEEADRRLKDERDALMEEAKRTDDEEIRKVLLDAWVDTKATERASTEFNAYELATAARACEAVDEDGVWSHATCDHSIKIWEVAEIRVLPEQLLEQLSQEMAELNFSVRQAKDSGKTESSSEPSPTPSEQEDLSPSTPAETSEPVPGTSASPSVTP